MSVLKLTFTRLEDFAQRAATARKDKAVWLDSSTRAVCVTSYADGNYLMEFVKKVECAPSRKGMLENTREVSAAVEQAKAEVRQVLEAHGLTVVPGKWTVE